MAKIGALRINEKDNVATCLENHKQGDTVYYEDRKTPVGVLLTEDIKFGHKLAVRPIMAGEEVIKYGFPVGVASRDIGVGQHVHIHNVDSLRCN